MRCSRHSLQGQQYDGSTAHCLQTRPLVAITSLYYQAKVLTSMQFLSLIAVHTAITAGTSKCHGRDIFMPPGSTMRGSLACLSPMYTLRMRSATACATALQACTDETLTRCSCCFASYSLNHRLSILQTGPQYCSALND